MKQIKYNPLNLTSKKVKSILKNKFETSRSNKTEYSRELESDRNSSFIVKTENNFNNMIKMDLNFLREEKEKSLMELQKTIEELESLNFHFSTKYFNGKTLMREKELRSHMKTLNCQKEAEEVKTSIQDLYQEIVKNILVIQDNMKEEIEVKKKDIENRISMRLMDAEVKHKKLIEDKIREQDSMLRQLNNFTSEMMKIKENYEILRKRIDNFYTSNLDFSHRIKEEEKKSKILNLQMKQYKIYLNDFKKKVKQEEVEAKVVTSLAFKQSKMVVKTEPNYPKGKSERNRRVETEEQITKYTTNYVLTTSRSHKTDQSLYQATKSTGGNSSNKFTANKVLLKVNKFPTTSNILTQTLNSIKYKMKTIKQQQNEGGMRVNLVTKRVNDIIENLKSSQFTIDIQNYKTNPTYDNTTNRGGLNLHFCKEDRVKLIDRLTRDRQLISLIEDEKFPTINNTYRTVNFVK